MNIIEQSTQKLSSLTETSRALGISKSFLWMNWRTLPGAFRVGRNIKFDIGELREGFRAALDGVT